LGTYDITAVAIDNTGISATNVVSAVAFKLDSDGDGIPDWWMIEYFGHPTGETNDNSMAAEDANSDGVSNLQEYQNGTDPTALPNLAILSGNDQIGSYGAFLPMTVTIQATHDDGTPWTNSLLTFAVTNGTALLAVETNDTPSATLSFRTDTNGLASAWVYFPPASSAVPDSTIVAGVSAGLNTNAVAIYEYVPLAHWRFDDTNSWIGEEGQLPLFVTNVVGIPSWSTNAVLVDNPGPAIINYQVVETNDFVNLNCQTGSVLFYFKPDWSSVNYDDESGTGPGTSARLIEIGSYNPAFTNGWWSLYFSPDGDQLFFATSTNGGGMTNLTADLSGILLASNEWYQIALTYSPSASALFVDGQQIATGAGVSYFPNADELTNGFRIGSDENGGNQAAGAFDELEAFASPLAGLPAPAEKYWFGIPDYKVDPNGTLAAWEMNYFGHIGLDPNGDYDGDGVNDLQEFLNGTDPNKISFSISFPNQYVAPNIVTGAVTIFGGVPSYYAVRVDNTNFPSATWEAYTSNITVNLGSTDGPHDVWIGLRGSASGAQQTWVETTFILDSALPTISITNPVDGVSLNATRVNVSGSFTAASLKDITVNGILAFVSGTNYEALNVPLAGGTNMISAVVEDLTGATNMSSIVIIGVTNSDGSMNDPVDLQATPIAGFAPLLVTFTIQTNVPGTVQLVMYDFNGDDIADFVTNNFDSINYTYATNGEYFPVVTIQTDAGRFSSVGGWNATTSDSSNQPVQINVQAALTQTTFISSISDPVDLKWDGTNLYVLSGSSGTITEFDTNGASIGTPYSIGAACSGFDMDAAGNVYVAVTASNQVWKFNPTGGSFAADTNFGFGGFIGDTNGFTGTNNGVFNGPFDVAVSPDGGTISVSDSGNNRIQQFSAANGAFTTSFGSLGSDVGQFNTPKGLAYDATGTLYIVDSGNNRIALAQNFGVVGVTGTNGTDLAQLEGPANISVGERGVYVADTDNNRVQSFSPPAPHNLFSIASSTIRFAAAAGFSAPAAVAAVDGPTNELFYVADTGNNRVILCNVPAENPDVISAVWDSMTTHIAAGDISGAAPYFSVASSDDYQTAFLSVGTANTISAINKIGALTPDYIGNDNAEFYFQQLIDGQTITFPVKFDKENGVWKILEF
jgi:DNA-binding beta-propeller fold protein YncE